MKYIKPIYEFRQQLELPFDNKHPLHGKPTHVHVKDALEDIKLKENPDNYTSDANIDELYKKHYNDALNLYLESWGWNEPPQDLMYNFINSYPISDNMELYSSEFINDLKSDDINIDDNYEVCNNIIYDELDYEYCLTKRGERELFSDFAKDQFESDLDTHDFLYSLEKDENGLIFIWRAIDFSEGSKNDVYENILEYGKVGIYWSWEERGAEPHGSIGGETYILCAKVKPEYVNWTNTIYKNAYRLKDEMEIELQKDTKVLLYDIILDKKWNMSKFRFEEKSLDIKPMIIPV